MSERVPLTDAEQLDADHLTARMLDDAILTQRTAEELIALRALLAVIRSARGGSLPNKVRLALIRYSPYSRTLRHNLATATEKEEHHA